MSTNVEKYTALLTEYRRVVKQLIAKTLNRFSVGRLLLRTYRRLRGLKPQDRGLKPQGKEGVKKLGHREYVGGRWEEIGKVQFDFLVQQGLKPQHYLADIACGSLRAGVHLIPYLDEKHYLGIEKEEELLERGVRHELGQDLYQEKKPQLVVSSTFEFQKFRASPDYAIAQSLFTHLPAGMVEDCLRKLREVIHPEGVFYATFNETDTPRPNRSEPHDHAFFAYTRDQMEEFGARTGWDATYIGEWSHPRHLDERGRPRYQMMMKYRPCPKS